jgi:hypothetical protein
MRNCAKVRVGLKLGIGLELGLEFRFGVPDRVRSVVQSRVNQFNRIGLC